MKAQTPSAIFVSMLGLSGLFLGAQAWAANPACEIDRPAHAQTFPCGVLVVGSSAGVAADIARGTGAKVKYQFDRLNAVALEVPHRTALNFLGYSSLKLFPDRPVHAHVMPQGKGKPSGGGTATSQITPSGITRIGGPIPSGGVGVAIADTGIDLANQDLTVGSARFDAFNESNSGQDLNGHGTHVAGIVAAKDNNIDVVGVVPDATVYPVRVLDASGSGNDSAVIAGLNWIANNANSVEPPIMVVNMSLGRPFYTGDDNPDHPMRLAIQGLVKAGIPVVVSAGNDQNVEITDMVPAGYPEVIAVASTTAETGSNQCRSLKAPIPQDTASYFTTDGAGVVVSAPGATRENVSKACFISSVGILSLKPGGGTASMSGTSMAAPHVTGTVAAMKSTTPALSPETIKGCLSSNADKKGSAPLASPTSSYTFDGTKEGVVLLSDQLLNCSN